MLGSMMLGVGLTYPRRMALNSNVTTTRNGIEGFTNNGGLHSGLRHPGMAVMYRETEGLQELRAHKSRVTSWVPLLRFQGFPLNQANFELN